jgi:hypothetical protein
MGCQKEGQPVPESNLASESNSGEPQQAQRYIPASWQSQYSPVKAGSVPFSRHTWYCSGVSCVLHSCSDFTIFSAIIFPSEAGIPDLPALDQCGHGAYCMSSMQMYWCYFAFFREFSMHDFASRIRKQGCATILAILQQKAVFQQSCFGHAAFP